MAQSDSFRQFLSNMVLTQQQKNQIYHQFECQIQKGLKKSTNAEAEVKCYPTYVQDLPTGNEEGRYMALDLGGTRFRVLCVQLAGKNPDIRMVKEYVLDDAILVGNSDQLFDFIANCIREFLVENNLADSRLIIPLGFTFSFPCVQQSLNKATLVRWTKAFKITGVEGKEVGALLNSALQKKHLPVECVAIINDTIGTLMSCAHRTENCRLGVIVGTGCNGCFIEPVEKVEMMDPIYKNKPLIIVNAEWGAFGDKGNLDFVRTEYDREIDEKSRNVGTQIHEKMVSGLYLGDLVALIISKAMAEGLIFEENKDDSRLAGKLHVSQTLNSAHVSEIEADSGPEYKKTKNILKNVLAIENPKTEDLHKIKVIAEAVSRRSADLVGINIAYLIARSGLPQVAVAIDGGVYKNFSNYRSYLNDAVESMLPQKIKFEIILSEDGSGRGAAIVASTAAKRKPSLAEPLQPTPAARQEYFSCRCDEE